MFEVFVDSTANVSLPLREEKRIHVLPMRFTMNGVEMDEGSCPYSAHEFYDLLRQGAVCETSLINTAAFIQAFRAALEEGKDVICITVSHVVSGTFQAAKMAAWELHERYPKRQIEIIDSLGLSLGEGLVALRAAELRDRGESAKKAAAKLRKLVDEMYQMLTVTDLKFLQRTGRLSGSAALIGGALNVKAVLVGNSRGECVVNARARGTRRALETMAQRWQDRAQDHRERVGIIHADNQEDAQRLLELLRQRGFEGECLMEVCEVVGGSHVGPGAVGLFFRGDRRET